MKTGKIVKKEKDDNERPIKAETPSTKSKQSNDRDYELTQSINSNNSKAKANGFKVESKPDSAKRKHENISSNDYFDYNRKYDEYTDVGSTKDYKILYDKKKEEMHKLLDKEKNYKRVIELLQRELDGRRDSNSKLKKLKEVESEKEELRLSVLEFIKNTSKYVPYNYSGDKITVREIQKFLTNLDSFLVQLVSENNAIRKPNKNNPNPDGKLIKFNEVVQHLNTDTNIRK
jgi:hypothetical protein